MRATGQQHGALSAIPRARFEFAFDTVATVAKARKPSHILQVFKKQNCLAYEKFHERKFATFPPHRAASLLYQPLFNKAEPSPPPKNALEQAQLFKQELQGLHPDGDWDDFGPQNVVHIVLLALWGAPVTKVKSVIAFRLFFPPAFYPFFCRPFLSLLCALSVLSVNTAFSPDLNVLLRSVAVGAAAILVPHRCSAHTP